MAPFPTIFDRSNSFNPFIPMSKNFDSAVGAVFATAAASPASCLARAAAASPF